MTRATEPIAERPRRYRSDTFEWGPLLTAVASARRRTCRVLEEWGLGELADDAAQIVSELVTNAVEAHRQEHLDAPVRLTLVGGLRTALIVVRDASDTAPDGPASPGDYDENGRGLIIVEALAAWWDIKPCPGGGKVIRAIVRGARQLSIAPEN